MKASSRLYIVLMFAQKYLQIFVALCIFAPAANGSEKNHKSGFAFYMENDMFATGNDRDYTGGFSLNLTGEIAHGPGKILSPPLSLANRILGLPDSSKSSASFSRLEAGAVVYTPENIETKAPLEKERPYANLVYLGSGLQTVQGGKKTSWRSSFSYGFLGTSAASNLQSEIHRSLDDKKPQGWENQISSGGEFTLLYEAVKESLLTDEGTNFQGYGFSGFSAGFISEARFGLALRAGILRDPWWVFGPSPGTIGPGASSAFFNHEAQSSLYVFAGAETKLRFYNAFLQGQFRESKVSYSASETNILLGEAFIGIAKRFGAGFSASYVFRYRTSELKIGKADRPYSWAGVLFGFEW